ncbi:MAG: bifunctional (p)ppGpp synthetase/guanosine-3',5'-bis(diphosphate) 3'-pyrophosphohydrolase [Deltaproteobacteria bacterium]|nr:bifunctional (p)ppGpp synthetase/guanosine-3',5'-bis(diphosphate) 3'-pyrophosphohydrolase [Deltaproteobacteria bacterium]
MRLHHEGQTRASGEPYVSHLTEVAALATKLRLDVPSIVTALLHDTVEDTDVTLDDLKRDFGADVAQLVDGVTKLNQINFSSRVEAQAESFRKMLLAMARDIRVLLVKLCDRVHNMRTLEFLSEARQTRIAQETLDIYAPLAHRLGIHWMKSELEDSAFRYLKPEIYEKVKQFVSQKRNERERYAEEVTKLIERELEQNGIHGEVTGRPKHFYSIYRKMERFGSSFEEIHDLIAFRVMVPTTMECYAALGAMHAAWKPVPGRFKDYIAMPKPNHYQSLHTTVIGPYGHRIEIQIRTREMHEIAESGIAAHWLYKSADKKIRMPSHDDLQFSWLRELVESGKMLRDPVEFMSLVKEDLFSNEVYVFSPKGDVVALSAGASPIDFAYHIHSELGHRCTGARANGQQVPLNYRLRNGDTVEIITSQAQTPHRDWLSMVQTSKAKQRIRAWLKSEERNRSITLGKELLQKDLRKVKMSYERLLKEGELERLGLEMGIKDLDQLLAEIGYGKISTTQIVARLLPDDQKFQTNAVVEQPSELRKIFQRAAKATQERAGIRVSGMDGMVFHFARCCEPLPGDELVGYITRGRGVTIHNRSCTQTLSFDPQRIVDVSWGDKKTTHRRIRIRVSALDRVGILAAMTQAIAAAGANIASANVSSTLDGKAMNIFELAVDSAEQLEHVIRGLEKLDGVVRVERERRKGDRI